MTALQCAIIWPLALVIVPLAIRAAERALGLPSFTFGGQWIVGFACLAAFTTLNVGTAAVLVRHGQGTPLPLDCPRRFVIVGPYRYVRNPMAIAGLGQGASVAILLGSWWVLAWVGGGIMVWHCIARPAEERDLEVRFGTEFVEYRASVRCWIPRLRPYGP